jgi:hypothetical protein
MNPPTALHFPRRLLCVFLAATAFSYLAPRLVAAEPYPQSGIPADAIPFRGKFFRVYLDDCGWKTALSKCQRVGGKLVMVPDKDTHDFLKKLANGRKLFIGGTNDRAGVWTWIDGTPIKFQTWDRGQPNNLKGREHYLAMGPNGNWLDVSEGGNWSQGYICEWQPAGKR